jgi:hypothetical protein
MIDLIHRTTDVSLERALHVYSGASARHLLNVGVMDMHNLIHWLASNGSILAILVTAGVAVLLVCCLGCSNCPAREKDELFRRHGM